MPVILRWKGYRFFFFSNEGDPREPVHVHVRKGSAIAKFWVDPEVTLADSWGMSSKELKSLKGYIEQNRDHIWEYWNEYFKL